MFLLKTFIIGQFTLISKLTHTIKTSEQKFAIPYTIVRRRQHTNM